MGQLLAPGLVRQDQIVALGMGPIAIGCGRLERRRARGDCLVRLVDQQHIGHLFCLA